MPRFRLSQNQFRPSQSGTVPSTFDHSSPEDDDIDLDDQFDLLQDQPRRNRRPAPSSAPRLVAEGRSGRVVADRDLVDDSGLETSAAAGDVVAYSSYDVATHGPEPIPDWLITSLSARDTALGVLKTGKEADVSLLDRSLPGGPGCLLAVKTYRDSHHRMFHRDSGYQEGRRVRRSREGRAMAARTTFGRELLSAKWASAEFAVLGRLWTAGAKVPYPVQILGSELMMEFIGGPDGEAAPRLAAYEGDSQDFTALWHDLVGSLETLANEGLTHGDLSAYNVLVHDGGCVVIDLPQAVDVVANPQGEKFLDRDCQVIADFFSRRGVLAADGELLAMHLGGIARS